MKRWLLLLLALAATAQPSWLPGTEKLPQGGQWMPGPFVKAATPLVAATQEARYQSPAVVKVEERFRMLYRRVTPEIPGGQLFLADSLDGVKWDRYPQPVFGPTDWYDKDGVDEPRLTFYKGIYFLTYTGFEGHVAHLCLATSPDLRGWRKRGPLFPQFPANGSRRYPENWTRAGAFFMEKMQNGPYKGRYIMVFGDSDLWFATSDDLLNWNYRPEPILRIRQGGRDCGALMAGAPLVRCRDGGLILIYNGADRDDRWATYAALLDQQDPTVVLARPEMPILEPTQIWESVSTLGTSLCLVDGIYSLFYGGGGVSLGLARATLPGR